MVVIGLIVFSYCCSVLCFCYSSEGSKLDEPMLVRDLHPHTIYLNPQLLKYNVNYDIFPMFSFCVREKRKQLLKCISILGKTHRCDPTRTIHARTDLHFQHVWVWVLHMSRHDLHTALYMKITYLTVLLITIFLDCLVKGHGIVFQILVWLKG